MRLKYTSNRIGTPSARIVILNGVGSSGKSSIAKALQAIGLEAVRASDTKNAALLLDVGARMDSGVPDPADDLALRSWRWREPFRPCCSIVRRGQ